MRSGKLRMIGLTAAAFVLLVGALALALSGPLSAAAQTTATPAGGMQTLATGTPMGMTTVEAGTPEGMTTAQPVATGTPIPVGTVAAPGAAPETPTVVPTTTVVASPTLDFGGPVPADAGVRSITVIGEGRASIEPDLANANIGVEVVTDTVRAATTQAREVMDDVLQALRDAGIAERDIQTSGFNIFAERNFVTPSGQPSGPDQVRYHVNNQVNVIIRDMDSVGDVLDAAIEAGANQIYGVNFRVSSAISAEEQAYNAALADARRRAEFLAGRVGLEVGAAHSISEVIGTTQVFNSRDIQAAGGMGGGGGPIQPGQLEIMRQLQVVFYLE